MNCWKTPAIALAFLLLPLSTDTMAAEIRVSGAGIRKCSEWQQWKDDKNGEARAMMIEWAYGFIAGHNVYAPKGYPQANSVVVDAKILIPLLDAYCQKSPDNRILSGVMEITQSLGGARLNMSPNTAPPSAPPSAPKPDPKKERDS